MDYLNPAAMLVPTNANNSFYAPSWDQMVMADTKRGLQADEALSHLNEKNASESVREKYKLPADIMKYQQQMAEDEAKTDPAYIQSMIQGKMGENLSSYLKGRMEQDLYDPTLAAGRAGLINKKQDHEWNSKYHQYAKLEDGIAGILNMNIPDPRIRGEKIKEMIRLHGGEHMSWLDPKNSMFLEKAAANPEGFLRTIHTQKNLMETQAQMFSMRELQMKHLYDMDLQGERNKADSKNRDTDKSHNRANVLIASADRLEAQADKLEMDLNRGYIVQQDGTKIDISKDAAAQQSYRTQINRKRMEAAQQRKAGYAELNLPYTEAPPPPPPEKKVIKLD